MATTDAIPDFIEQFSIWVGVVGTTVGVIVLFGRAVKEWLQAFWSKGKDEDSSEVERKRVAISEKEAQTHEVSVLLEGFSELLTSTREQVKVAEARAEEAHTRIDTMQRVAQEMINHIIILETGYPNPPGPPTRPNWNLQ